MMTFTTVMFNDQSFESDDALLFRHKERTLSFIIKYYYRDALSVVYLI